MVITLLITGCTSVTVPIEDVPDVGPSFEGLSAPADADATYELMFHEAPATVTVGQTIQLSVQAHDAGQPTMVQRVSFESRTPDLLSIDAAGQAKGLAVGTAYLQAHNERGMALAEIQVIEP